MTSSSTWLSRLIAAALLLSSAFPAAAQTVSFVESKDFAVGRAPVSVAAGDFNRDSVIDLAVANRLSDTVSVLVGDGNGTFQAARDFAAGSSPVSVAVGDFNGDGSPDLAVADFNGGVSVLLGNGDGTFQVARAFTAGTNPQFVAVGDFNRDGVLDLAVANSSSNDVSVLLGNADGSFQAARTFAVGRSPMSVAAGDFNGDGVPDLAITNLGDYFRFDLGNVSVLLGNGDGTFQAARTFTAGLQPVSVAVADFNDDGHLDLAVANRFSMNLSVLLGNGDGTFQTHRDFGASANEYSHPESVVVSDFNGDGRRDLAVARGTDHVVSVLLGNGDGTFQTARNYASTGEPLSVATADFSGDGVPDLAVADSSYNLVSVMLGNGDGTLQAVRIFSPGGGSLAMGDVNGDGVADVAVAGDSYKQASMMLGNGDGTFQPALTFGSYSSTGCSHIYGVSMADLNGDGKPDLVVTCEKPVYPYVPNMRIAVLLGNGDGTFQSAVWTFDFDTGFFYGPWTLRDFNGDGALDILVTENDTVRVLLGNGDGTFQPPGQAFDAGPYPASVAVGDFNSDGTLDVAVADFGHWQCQPQCSAPENGVSVLLGNGDGTFQARARFDAGSAPRSLVVADFNGDWLPDLAVVSAGNDPNNVAILLGSGDGTFQAARAFAAGAYAYSVVVGDFNGDGAADLAVGASGTTVLLGNGDGSFQMARTFAPYDAFFSAAVGDVNGDGKMDLVTNRVAVLINNTARATYDLAVTKDGNGAGTVTSSSRRAGASEIDCGSSCTATYASGTLVTLTAQPAVGSTFASWKGCDAVFETTCTVTMSEAKSVVATFVLQQFTLNVSKDGIGKGTVTSSSNPAGATQINCGVACSVTYDWSTVVTLSATPAFGNVFVRWSGCDAVSGASCIVTMSSVKSVTATFLGVPLNPLPWR